MDSNFRFRVRCKPRLRPQAQREIPISVHLIAGWPRWQLLSFQESDIIVPSVLKAAVVSFCSPM